MSGAGYGAISTVAEGNAIPTSLLPSLLPSLLQRVRHSIAATGTKNATQRRLFLLVLVAVATRLVTFGNPILHVDEQYYFVVADAWRHGALPYVDIWDRKPVGLFLLYLPAALLGLPLGIWAYQALALASLTGTAWLICRLADRAGWQRGALAGGLAYIIWVGLVEGEGGQAPIFYNLPMIAAAALIAPRPGSGPPKIRSGIAAMSLVGLALQIKYSAVFEGMFFGCWLLWQQARAGRRVMIVPIGIGLVAAAVLPTAIAWLAFAHIGAGAAWLYANVTSILARRPDPLLEQFGNLAIITLILSPLLAAAVLSWRLGKPDMVQRWLFAWLAAAVLGLLVFGSWFDHYALPVMVPAAICAAGFFGHHPTGRRLALPILIVAFLGAQATLLGKRAARGTPAQFRALAAAIGPGPGCLYVYSRDAMLYPATGRCRLSRYAFPSHLSRTREQGAIGVDQRSEMVRILAARPAIVVMRPPYRGERGDVRALVVRNLRAHYRLRAVRPLGAQAIGIFVRNPA